MMHILTEIYLQREVRPEQLAQATAKALDVHKDSVAVVPAGTAIGRATLKNPAMAIVFQREPDDQPGDFPARYVVSVCGVEQLFKNRLPQIAHNLSVTIATDIDAPEGDGAWRLFLPDGTTRIVQLDPGALDNDALSLGTSDRADVERITLQSARRSAA